MRSVSGQPDAAWVDGVCGLWEGLAVVESESVSVETSMWDVVQQNNQLRVEAAGCRT